MDAPRACAFKVPQNDSLMADAIAGYMAANGVKSVGFIGFNDAYGDGWAQEFDRAGEGEGPADRRGRTFRPQRHFQLPGKC